MPALAWSSREGVHCIVALSVGGADRGYCTAPEKGGNLTGEHWVLVTVTRGRDELEIRLPRSVALELAAALVHRANDAMS